MVPVPTVILFDAVGTLMTPEPNVAVAYAEAGARHGCRLPVDEVQRRFSTAFARQEQIDRQRHALVTGSEREMRRWRDIVGEVFPGAADGPGLFAQLWEHFAQPGHWRVYDDAAAAIERLAAKGRVMGVASNFDERLHAICRQLPPLERLAHVFVSEQLGCRKPGLAFFRAIEQQLGVPPGQIMLVGDDLENDYHAARAAGWQTVLVDRRGEHAEVPRRVRDLREWEARLEW